MAMTRMSDDDDGGGDDGDGGANDDDLDDIVELVEITYQRFAPILDVERDSCRIIRIFRM